MGGVNSRINFASKIPTVIMMCGLQGSGKTTHSGKLAYYFKKQGKRPLLVACDVYRPAAIDQLKVVGEKAGVPVFEMGQIDPVTIAKNALAHARDHGNDFMIIDTAGRLHIDEVLMDELKNLKREIQPNEILLVIDAMTGQDAVNVAGSFNEALGIDGVILTKLDGDTRGGAALSVRAVTGKPIKFAGMGEKIGDLEPFYPDRMASRILGMGDVLTLIDKVQSDIDAESAMKVAEKMKNSRMDFNDLMEQIRQMHKMGPLSSVLNMLPGAAGKIGDAEAEAGEKQLKITEAIISSMTPAEREKPSLINPSRKRRIAAGSGTRVEDVNRQLRQLEQMQKMVKQMGKLGKKGRRMGFGGMNMNGLPF